MAVVAGLIVLLWSDLPATAQLPPGGVTPSPSPAVTASPTRRPTAAPTRRPTARPTPRATPTPTPSPTPEPTPTPSPVIKIVTRTRERTVGRWWFFLGLLAGGLIGRASWVWERRLRAARRVPPN